MAIENNWGKRILQIGGGIFLAAVGIDILSHVLHPVIATTSASVNGVIANPAYTSL